MPDCLNIEVKKGFICSSLKENVGKGDGEQADEDQPGDIAGKVDEDDRNRTDGQQQKTTLGEV